MSWAFRNDHGTETHVDVRDDPRTSSPPSITISIHPYGSQPALTHLTPDEVDALIAALVVAKNKARSIEARKDRNEP